MGTTSAIQQPSSSPRQVPRSLFREILAVLLLTVGSLLLPGIAWLVGVALLWASDRWRAGEKLLGTLVWPFGYAGVLVLATYPASSCVEVTGHRPQCTGTQLPPILDVVIAVILIAAPAAVGTYLLLRARQRRLAAL